MRKILTVLGLVALLALPATASAQCGVGVAGGFRGVGFRGGFGNFGVVNSGFGLPSVAVVNQVPNTSFLLTPGLNVNSTLLLNNGANFGAVGTGCGGGLGGVGLGAGYGAGFGGGFGVSGFGTGLGLGLGFPGFGINPLGFGVGRVGFVGGGFRRLGVARGGAVAFRGGRFVRR